MQCSPLNSNSGGPTKYVLIMRCSIYEFALNIKCKYNRVISDHNHLSELTGFLDRTALYVDQLKCIRIRKKQILLVLFLRYHQKLYFFLLQLSANSGFYIDYVYLLRFGMELIERSTKICDIFMMLC